ncbi:hypothetical protein [Algibacter sp. PT7-4]|uniref:hypothetical protein n=1 Tax=Algibacter ulvanivorans TaxID=3400999 RepID=UPI003AAD1804
MINLERMINYRRLKNISKLSALCLACCIYTAANSQALHLYGGNNHKEYLGCLTCSNYDSNSIWNAYGTYGNNYNSKSIWNEYGTFGNEYNAQSPWNEYANNPPVVVDKNGNFYGYFTINEYKSKRADFKLALLVYKYHKQIREDVSVWYSEIFK